MLIAFSSAFFRIRGDKGAVHYLSHKRLIVSTVVQYERSLANIASTEFLFALNATWYHFIIRTKSNIALTRPTCIKLNQYFNLTEKIWL